MPCLASLFPQGQFAAYEKFLTLFLPLFGALPMVLRAFQILIQLYHDIPYWLMLNDDNK